MVWCGGGVVGGMEAKGVYVLQCEVRDFVVSIVFLNCAYYYQSIIALNFLYSYISFYVVHKYRVV